MVVFDSGALTKIASERDPTARALWRRLTELGWAACIPAVTLAESLTGKLGADAAVNRLIKQVGRTSACDERLARLAAKLRGGVSRGGRDLPSGIDAIVAAIALEERPAIVLTTDAPDIASLLSASAGVAVISV